MAVQRVVSAIRDVIDTHEDALRGGVGLFNASDKVTRAEWRDYVASLEMGEYYPGIGLIGFSKFLDTDEITAHIAEVHSDGLSDYQIWPQGEQATVAPIVFIEPTNPGHRSMYGYDLYSEPTHRDAMEWARDSGHPAISRLVNVTVQTPESEFLNIAPIYRKGPKPSNSSDRKATLEGYVFSVVRMADMMRSISIHYADDVAIAIYDGTTLSTESRIYESAEVIESPLYSSTVQIEVGGNIWSLRTTSLPAFENSLSGGRALEILIYGLIISSFIVAGISIMAKSGHHAVTLAQETNAAHLQSEERFAGMFDTAAHGIGMSDLNGRWIKVNQALCDLLGYSEQDLLEFRFQDVTHPDDLDDDLKLFDQALAGEFQSYQREKRYVHKDGKIVFAQVNNVLVRNDKNEPVHFISQILDLTDRQEAQQQLIQAQKMEAVGQLTGGLAHDFNNLLAIILGNLQLLEQSIEDDDDVTRRINSAVDAAKRGAEITHRLLAFSRRQKLETAVIPINELVSGMADLLRGTLGEDITLEILLHNKDLYANIDAYQLETAILNLAVNARDAMTKGGHLKIETRPVQQDELNGDNHPEVGPGDYLAIRVFDNGHGMPEEIIDKIFQPFFSTKDVGKGTGLGLSMVYGFAKQSGGHVEIQSKEDAGTTVTLYLPQAMNVVLGSTASAVDRFTDEYPRGDEIVLVVEDNIDVQDVTVSQIKDLGYDVVVAQNGLEAIAVLERNPDIAIVYTDVVMPGTVNGVDLVAKASARYPGLKFMITSGYAEISLLERADIDSPKVLLTKPVDKTVLARAMRQILDEGKEDVPTTDVYVRAVG